MCFFIKNIANLQKYKRIYLKISKYYKFHELWYWCIINNNYNKISINNFNPPKHNMSFKKKQVYLKNKDGYLKAYSLSEVKVVDKTTLKVSGVHPSLADEKLLE